MKKRVLLAMPSHFSIYKMIKANLEKIGYKVTYQELEDFKYKNFRQRVYNFIRKTFLRDREFKTFLAKKVIENNIRATFQNNNEYFDYTLVIRPDRCNLETISILKERSKKMIAYQWDGFSRFDVPDEIISTFDTFAVFDKVDYDNKIKKYPNLVLTNNFYFDFFPIPTQRKYDLLYIGSSSKDRFENLEHIAYISKGKNNYFRLFFNKKYSEYIIQNEEDEFFEYETNLAVSSQAKIVIDIKNSVHDGLSLRFFEALYFSQKMITDNKTVKEMDFYNPNNILVMSDLKDLTKENLDDFLNKEYVEIPREIKEKYSFESWFNQMIS